MDEGENNFQVDFSNIQEPQKMLTSSVNQPQTKPIKDPITAYFDQLSTTNGSCDDEGKIEKNKS